MRYLDHLQPLGLLVLRLVLGVIMTVHGYGKVLGGGMTEHYHFVQSIGLPGWLAFPSAFAELFGGLLLVVGLVTRIAAFTLCVDMVVAVVWVHWRNGLTGKGGYEYPLSLAAIAFALVFFGAGPIALDWVFGRGGRKGAAKAAR